ncbi:MAG: hypothetical protein Q9164_004651 [Protoblastenia rupestris]
MGDHNGAHVPSPKPRQTQEPNSSKALEAFILGLTDKEKRLYHRRFGQVIHAQQLVDQYGFEASDLADIFSRLPFLTSLNYDNSCPEIPGSKFDLKMLSFIGRLTLTEPHKLDGCDLQIKQIEALFVAASKSNRLLDKFSGHDYLVFEQEVDIIKRPSHLLRNMKTTLQECRYLKMMFSYEEYYIFEEGGTWLGNLVGHMEKLQTLDLGGWDLPVVDDDFPAYPKLSELTHIRSHWAYLARLALARICCSESRLIRFLSDHRSTLRSLYFDNMLLYEHEQSEETRLRIWRHRREPLQSIPANWIRFIVSLPSILTLKHVKFSGTLNNGLNETWSAIDPDTAIFQLMTSDQPGPPTGGWLEHRIEDYVVHGGAFPLPIPRDLDCCSPRLYQLYARTETDLSWRFNTRCLDLDKDL